MESLVHYSAIVDRHVGGSSVEAGFRRHDASLHMASVLVYGAVDRAGDVRCGVDHVRRIPTSIEEKDRPSLLVGIFGWR